MPQTREQKNKYMREVCFARKNAYLQIHGPCIKCGSWENLEFHHRDPKTKIRTICWSWKTAILLAEIAKCDILCRMCHIATKPFVHGTYSCYVNAYCRCKLCTNAARLHSKSQRMRIKDDPTNRQV
jgi:hypothetical protein